MILNLLFSSHMPRQTHIHQKLLLSAIAIYSSPSLRTIVLRGGVLINGNGGPPLPDADMIVQGDRIQAARPRGAAPLPAGAVILDVPGKTALPGFMNAHAHYTHIVCNLYEWGREGVTTVRNLACDWIEYRFYKDFIAQTNDPPFPESCSPARAWMCPGAAGISIEPTVFG